MPSIFRNSETWAGLIDSLALFWECDPGETTYCYGGEKKASPAAQDWGHGVQLCPCGNQPFVTGFIISKIIIVLFGIPECGKAFILLF